MLLEISLRTFENSQNEDLKNELQRLYKEYYQVTKKRAKYSLFYDSDTVAKLTLKLCQISSKIDKLESEQNPD